MDSLDNQIVKREEGRYFLVGNDIRDYDDIFRSARYLRAPVCFFKLLTDIFV